MTGTLAVSALIREYDTCVDKIAHSVSIAETNVRVIQLAMRHHAEAHAMGFAPTLEQTAQLLHEHQEDLRTVQSFYATALATRKKLIKAERAERRVIQAGTLAREQLMSAPLVTDPECLTVPQ